MESCRLPTLDSVRGCAALVVVVHHCLLLNPGFSDFFFSTWRTEAQTTLQWAMFHTPARLAWAGSEAVILFYVLSGLVLSLPWIQGRPVSSLGFLVKRLCRLYIPYIACIAISAVLASALQHRASVAGLSRWFNEMSWTNPVTRATVLDHVGMIGRTNTINGVVHSLIWEVRVSIIFPLIMAPIARFRYGGVALVIGALAGTIVLVRVVEFGFGPDLWREHSSGFYNDVEKTAFYAFFFVLGVLLALNLQAIRGWLHGRSSLASWALLGLGLLVLQQHWTRKHDPQDIIVGLGAAMIIAGSLGPGSVERTFLRRELRLSGKIAYSLYLTHVPLLLCSVILLHNLVDPYWIAVGVALLSIPNAWLFYRLVELPSHRLSWILDSLVSRNVHQAARLRDAAI